MSRLQEEIFKWPTIFNSYHILQIYRLSSRYRSQPTLNKHKITTAKKFEAKRAQKSALKELAAGQNQHASTSANQELFNNQDMDLDVKVSY